MVFGSPFSDKYPSSVLNSFMKSRKGKDFFSPFYKLLDSTRLYDHVLKHTPRYWIFTIFGGCVTCYYMSNAFDFLWQHVNKGRLYIHQPNDYEKLSEEE